MLIEDPVIDVDMESISIKYPGTSIDSKNADPASVLIKGFS